MSMNPINTLNAVDCAALVILFTEAIPQNALHNLLNAHQNGEFSDIPEKSECKESENNDILAFTLGLSNPIYKNQSQPFLDWQLTFQAPDRLFFLSRHYTRWKNFSEMGLGLLEKAIEILEMQGKFQSISLEVIDRFLTKEIKLKNIISENNQLSFECEQFDYEKYNIFNLSSPYTSVIQLHIRNETHVWHIQHGWAVSNIQNTLNINSQFDLPNSQTFSNNIQHILSYHLAIEQRKQPLDLLFNELHQENKQVLKEILRIEQQEAIGLCKR